MNKILNILSITGSFLIVFGILFLSQDLTIGRIDFLEHTIIFKYFQFKTLLFTATSLLFILKFVDFYVPNRKSNCTHN